MGGAQLLTGLGCLQDGVTEQLSDQVHMIKGEVTLPSSALSLLHGQQYTQDSSAPAETQSTAGVHLGPSLRRPHVRCLPTLCAQSACCTGVPTSGTCPWGMKVARHSACACRASAAAPTSPCLAASHRVRAFPSKRTPRPR